MQSASMPSFEKIGVLGKIKDDRVHPAINDLCRLLAELGCEVIIDQDTQLEGPIPGLQRTDTETLVARADLIVVVGGDGTLLRAGRKLQGRNTPILGIHYGRLGFLVDVTPDDMRESVKRILDGEFWIEDRLILNARIIRDSGVIGPLPAINDVVIRNQAAVRMLEFETWRGEEFISRHRADGFIVATPTGSTAYALSGGGPVLHPGMDAVTLVPICPHTLSDRPLVVGADRPVRVVLSGPQRDHAMMTCDGQFNQVLRPGETLEISRSDDTLRLVHPKGYNYFDILRKKLHWGQEKFSPGREPL